MSAGVLEQLEAQVARDLDYLFHPRHVWTPTLRAPNGAPAFDVAIVGGGIAGLALALGLHQRGILSRVYEVAPEIKNLGVGITMLPHAMRELTALGLHALQHRGQG